MFYRFNQNNSGGRFNLDDEKGIGPKVWIEANSSAEAEERAEELGIYFNGVKEGRDCSCCGNRWSFPWESSQKVSINANYDFIWHYAVYIHNLDGTITKITEEGLS